jgi:polyhydroxybutyrate depolymerase
MRRPWLLAILALLAAWTATTGTAWGGETEERIVVDGAERFYTIVLPEGLKGPVPLVMVLHGAGGTRDRVEQVSGFTQLGQQKKFAVIYPKGQMATLLGMYSGQAWNSGYLSAKFNHDDVKFLKAILQREIGFRRADPARCYIVGFSNGGMMAYRMACEYAEGLAGIMVVAGSMNGKCAKPRKSIPVLMVHGTKDELVPFEGGKSDRAAALNQKGYGSVGEAVSFWRKVNGASLTPVRHRYGRMVEETWGGISGCPVRLCTIEGYGHGWPSGIRFAGMDLASYAWRYFTYGY